MGQPGTQKGVVRMTPAPAWSDQGVGDYPADSPYLLARRERQEQLNPKPLRRPG